MQPYQEASEEILRESKRPGEALKTGVKTAAGLIGGGAVLNRVAPFLNKFISPNIAAKGLEKVDSRFGKFIKESVQNGNSIEDAISFIKDKISPEQESTKEHRGVIQQYSDELDSFIKERIQKGLTTSQISGEANKNPKLKKVIDKLVNDHKVSFLSLLESDYPDIKKFEPARQPQQPQQNSPQQQAQPQSGGNNDQMLMAALEKILSM